MKALQLPKVKDRTDCMLCFVIRKVGRLSNKDKQIYRMHLGFCSVTRGMYCGAPFGGMV